jgi:hypothetical protein
MEVKCPKCGLVADCTHFATGWRIMGGTVAEVSGFAKCPSNTSGKLNARGGRRKPTK